MWNLSFISEEDFINLCKKAHNLGIKIILDGVFSLCSLTFSGEGEFGADSSPSPPVPFRIVRTYSAIRAPPSS